MKGRIFDPVFLAVGLTLYVLDQVTKLLIARALGPEADRHSVQIVGDWVRLSYTTNTGAAFGILPSQSTFFALVALIAIPTIWYFNRTLTPRNLLTRICLGALLGGTLGNLTDRLRLGYVVDFVDVGVESVRWPAFNVADSSFVVGIIVLCGYMILFDTSERRARDETYA